jgi:ParB family chromosome partitioning protein
MAEKRRGLGRGLGALIPTGVERESRPIDVFFPGAPEDADASVFTSVGPALGLRDLGPVDGLVSNTVPADGEEKDSGLVPVPGAYFAEVDVTDIRANSRQPRTHFDDDALAELVASIREIGVLQPVVLRPLSPPEDGVHFELIMGERRWRASIQAGQTTVPAIVRETADSDLLRDALLENLHRSDLNPLEEAAAYQQLLDDFECTHEELAQRIHRSRPQITNTLRLLRLPPLVQRRVAAGVLSAGHARALLALPDAAAMERLAQRIVAEGLSVRATEEVVALGGDPEKRSKPRAPRPGDRIQALDDLATRLSDRLDTRVKVSLGKTKGRLTVEFASVQDLNRILDVLTPDDPGLLR